MTDLQGATVVRIVSLLKRFPIRIQKDILFGRSFLGIPSFVMVPAQDGNGSRIISLTTDEDIQIGLDVKYDQMLSQSRSVEQCFWYIAKPNRLQIFDVINHIYKIADPEYSAILKNIWIATEFPHQMPIPTLVNLFKRANPEILMSSDEKTIYQSLDEDVIIYRGLPDKRAKVRGLSWTTDPKKADWFANRFKHDGTIYKSEIKKSHIFMYTDERNESECVVNPRYLRNVVPI